MPTYAEMAVLYPDMETIILLEIKKKKRIDNKSWTQAVAPNTNCWWIPLSEGKPEDVDECVRATLAIMDYGEQLLLTDCHAIAGSWYWDSGNGRLYVHTTGSDSPATADKYYLKSYHMERIATDEIVVDGKPYKGYLQSANIPDISTAITGFSKGGIEQEFGTVSIINADGHYDAEFYDYIYEAAEVDAKMFGRYGTIESDIMTMWTGWTGRIEWNDLAITIAIEDLRKAVP